MSESFASASDLAAQILKSPGTRARMLRLPRQHRVSAFEIAPASAGAPPG